MLAVAFQHKLFFKGNAVVHQQTDILDQFFGIVFIKGFQNIFKRRVRPFFQIKDYRKTARTSFLDGFARIIDFFVGINKGEITVFGSVKRFCITLPVTVQKIVFWRSFKILTPLYIRKANNAANAAPKMYHSSGAA